MGLAVYMGVVLVFSSIQERLIFPGAFYKQPRKRLMADHQELVHLITPGGEKTVLMFSRTQVADPGTAPTILIFYGNGMHLSDCLQIMARFNGMGVNAATVDYVGYGLASGKPSEAGCYDAAEAAWRHIRSRGDIRQDQLFVGGWSLGGAMATRIAATHDGEMRGVVLLCSFTSMADVAKQSKPFLPIDLILKHRFESAANLRRTTVPVYLAHGTADEVVPSKMSPALAKVAEGRSTLVMVHGAGHNNFFDRGWDTIEPGLQEWVRKTLTASAVGTTIPAR